MADNAAVLPFFNYTKSANLDWIGESVAERIRESLASEGLLLASREDRTEVYHRLAIRPTAILTRATIFKIGQSLDTSQVIFGQYELTPAASPAGPHMRPRSTPMRPSMAPSCCQVSSWA